MKAFGLLCNRAEPTVYVMICICCPDLNNYKYYLKSLRQGVLKSILCNKKNYRKLVLLINDDTVQEPTALYDRYKAARDVMLQGLGLKWYKTESRGGEGKDCAMSRLRRLFVETASCDTDIAVIFDQDDRLKSRAVRRIARKAKCGGIVVLPSASKKQGKLGKNEDEVDRLVKTLMADEKNPNRRLRTPNQRYYLWLRIWAFVFAIVFSLSFLPIFKNVFCLLAGQFGFSCSSLCPQIIKELYHALSSSLPESSLLSSAVLGAIFAFLLGEKGKVKLLVEQEASTLKLYCSEIKDLIRNLEASLKIMLRIREELMAGKKTVEWVHFGNMVLPETSILFSDDIPKYIPRSHVDDFARLKINLRNINNSAVWLRRKALRGEDMLEALEWEITRYHGYIVRFNYMCDNHFEFNATLTELDNYVKEHCVLEKLSKKLRDSVHDFSWEVRYFYGKYKTDRKCSRAVLCD